MYKTYYNTILSFLIFLTINSCFANIEKCQKAYEEAMEYYGQNINARELLNHLHDNIGTSKSKFDSLDHRIGGDTYFSKGSGLGTKDLANFLFHQGKPKIAYTGKEVNNRSQCTAEFDHFIGYEYISDGKKEENTKKILFTVGESNNLNYKFYIFNIYPTTEY